jgi:hypothetical protein
MNGFTSRISTVVPRSAGVLSLINSCRRTVRDDERLPQRHAAMVQWAMIIIIMMMTRRLARHQPAA